MRLDDDFQAQDTQRLQGLAISAVSLPRSSSDKKRITQVAEPGDCLQRQAPLFAMGARQAAESLDGLELVSVHIDFQIQIAAVSEDW